MPDGDDLNHSPLMFGGRATTLLPAWFIARS